MSLALVKLGGSVLTDKSSYRTPRPAEIARLAKELAGLEGRLVVVHGAGSFGHVLARQHKLADGVGPAQRAAFAQVHADVRELSALLLRELRAAGLPGLALSTSDLSRLMSGELRSFAAGPVQETLDAGFVPVLHGDVVLDVARGGGVLSGDVLMVELARALRPARAVFATDVEGIFDRWPGGALLPHLGVEGVHGAKGSSQPDITGGMAGKLERARAVARLGVPVHVVNGMVPGRVADALAGRPVVGTLVSP